MAIGTPVLGTLAENATAASTLSVPWPATTAGQQAVLFVSSSNATPPTLPAGWTSVARFGRTGSTLTPSLLVAIRACTGIETGNVNVTTPNVISLGRILVVSGVDSTTPQDVTASTVDGTSGSTVPIPGITTTVAGTLLLAFAAIANTGATSTPATAPATFTEWVDRSASTRVAAADYLLWSGSGSTGTVTVNFNGAGGGIGVLMALRPLSLPSGTAAGTRTRTGTATGAVSTSGTASGVRVRSGSANGTHSSAGASTGATSRVGSATGLAPSVTTNAGTASGSTIHTGTAAGSRSSRATAAGATVHTGTAAGTRTAAGSASGSTTRTGSAAGVAPFLAPSVGSATGHTVRTGSSTSSRPSAGAATGARTWVGTVVGVMYAYGSATGLLERTGTASGERPAEPVDVAVLAVVDRSRTSTITERHRRINVRVRGRDVAITDRSQ